MNIFLEKGTHYVQTFYQADSTQDMENWDWNLAWLQVDYWKP